MFILYLYYHFCYIDIEYVAILHMFYTLIHEVACFQRHTFVAISNAGCFAYMQCIIGVLFCGPFFRVYNYCSSQLPAWRETEKHQHQPTNQPIVVFSSRTCSVGGRRGMKGFKTWQTPYYRPILIIRWGKLWYIMIYSSPSRKLSKVLPTW